MGTFLFGMLVLMAAGFHCGFPYQQGHHVVWVRTRATKALVVLCIVSALLVAYINYNYAGT